MKPSKVTAQGVNCLVVCNGAVDLKLLKSLCAQVDWIVAADGGAEHLRNINVCPDQIIGDLDSVSKKTLALFKGAQVIEKKSQHKCDLEKVLDEGLKQGWSKVCVVGAEGKRFDYTLANVFIAWNYVSKMDMEFWTKDFKVFPILKSSTFKTQPKKWMTLIPLGTCRLTLKGFLFDVKNKTFRLGEVGVSNVCKNSSAQVLIHHGQCLVMIER